MVPPDGPPPHGPASRRKSTMSEKRTRLVSVGEVMIEMTRAPDGRFGQACAGDTFNTAVYLARRGFDYDTIRPIVADLWRAATSAPPDDDGAGWEPS